MKPKIFYNSEKSKWICATSIWTLPSGIRIYYPNGVGRTPKEAYYDAFPRTWMQKLTDWMRI